MDVMDQVISHVPDLTGVPLCDIPDDTADQIDRRHAEWVGRYDFESSI